MNNLGVLLLTVPEAARVLGIGRSTVYELIARGGRAHRPVVPGAGLGDRGIRRAAAGRREYEILLRRHIIPMLGDATLAKLTPSTVRSWHARLSDGPRPGASTVAKSYRLSNSRASTPMPIGCAMKVPSPGGSTS